jgi:hypothetical protein
MVAARQRLRLQALGGATTGFFGTFPGHPFRPGPFLSQPARFFLSRLALGQFVRALALACLLLAARAFLACQTFGRALLFYLARHRLFTLAQLGQALLLGLGPAPLIEPLLCDPRALGRKLFSLPKFGRGLLGRQLFGQPLFRLPPLSRLLLLQALLRLPLFRQLLFGAALLFRPLGLALGHGLALAGRKLFLLGTLGCQALAFLFLLVQQAIKLRFPFLLLLGSGDTGRFRRLFLAPGLGLFTRLLVRARRSRHRVGFRLLIGLGADEARQHFRRALRQQWRHGKGGILLR